MIELEIRGARAQQILDDETFQAVIDAVRRDVMNDLSTVDISRPETAIQPIAMLKAIDALLDTFRSMVISGKYAGQRPPVA